MLMLRLKCSLNTLKDERQLGGWQDHFSTEVWKKYSRMRRSQQRSSSNSWHLSLPMKMMGWYLTQRVLCNIRTATSTWSTYTGSTRPAKSLSHVDQMTLTLKVLKRPLILPSNPGKAVESIQKNNIAEPIHIRQEKVNRAFVKENTALLPAGSSGGGEESMWINEDPVALDFQKAFHKASHQRLLKKLS